MLLFSADPPQFSPATATATPTEGEQFTVSFDIDANPAVISDNITLTKNSAPVTDTRVTVTATNLTIASVTHDDSGEYQVTAGNVVGSGTFTLTVDVYCECVCVCVCVCTCVCGILHSLLNLRGGGSTEQITNTYVYQQSCQGPLYTSRTLVTVFLLCTVLANHRKTTSHDCSELTSNQSWSSSE